MPLEKSGFHVGEAGVCNTPCSASAPPRQTDLVLIAWILRQVVLETVHQELHDILVVCWTISAPSTPRNAVCKSAWDASCRRYYLQKFASLHLLCGSERALTTAPGLLEHDSRIWTAHSGRHIGILCLTEDDQNHTLCHGDQRLHRKYHVTDKTSLRYVVGSLPCIMCKRRVSWYGKVQ